MSMIVEGFNDVEMVIDDHILIVYSKTFIRNQWRIFLEYVKDNPTKGLLWCVKEPIGTTEIRNALVNYRIPTNSIYKIKEGVGEMTYSELLAEAIKHFEKYQDDWDPIITDKHIEYYEERYTIHE